MPLMQSIHRQLSARFQNRTSVNRSDSGNLPLLQLGNPTTQPQQMRNQRLKIDNEMRLPREQNKASSGSQGTLGKYVVVLVDQRRVKKA